MLNTLLGEVAAAGSFVLRVLVDDEVKKDWPCCPAGRQLVELPVDASGIVALAPLINLQCIGREGCLVKKQWIKHMEVADMQSISLLEFMQRACRAHSMGHCKGLWVQLAHEVGDALDKLVADRHGALPSAVVSMQVVPDDDLLGNEPDMHAALVLYVERTRQLLSPAPLHLSLATDKSCVRSFQLQNTASALPSNKAVWLCPQVCGRALGVTD